VTYGDSLGPDRQAAGTGHATRPATSERARTLLETVRQTPMRRGRLDERRRILRGQIETTLENQGILPRLATRNALQLVLKCRPRNLGDRRVWHELGAILTNEIRHLQQGLRLTDRLITVGLRKLSADDIEHLFQDMRAIDANYRRTLAEAALDGAEPRAMGLRYGQAFKASVDKLMATIPESPERWPQRRSEVAIRSRTPSRT
jgi:hypothetical protein